MNPSEVYRKIDTLKLVPVVKLEQAKDALPLCEALAAGGLPTAEITFRTDAAEEAIRISKQKFPDMLIGAGTVVSAEQAARALAAGADFIVSPGTSPAVIEFAQAHQIAIFPGVCTPSEVMAALAYGIKVVKFFPAAQYGGLQTIKALAAPFGDIRFMPTGGVNAENLLDYLRFPKITACGGSWMVQEKYILNAEFQKITQLTKEATDLIRTLNG